MEAGEQSRRYGIREGAAYAVMQGGGENYLSAFALLLHANAFQIGLLSALPQLLGTWFQLLSVKAMTRFDSRKAIILVGTAGQAAMWLPLMALPLLFPAQAPWLLIAAAVAYFAMGHFSVPAWNSLIVDLVVPDRRGAYFASRAKIIAVTGFAALCAAGFILHWTEARGAPWAGFAAIFLLAAAARVISTRYFACIDETVVPVTREAAGGLGEFLRDRGNRGFVRFLAFSGLMHVSVCIAGPYFVLYLLRDLQFSYLQYASWLSAQVLGQLLSLHRWGWMIDTFGNKKVLLVTGFFVSFVPMLYLFSDDFVHLVMISFVGGVTWAGLSLSLQNYVFDMVRAEDRAKGVAIWNNVNAIGWFAGAMLGSWLASAGPTRIVLLGFELRLISNLPAVFFLSGLLRLVVSLSFLNSLKEGRTVVPISHRRLVSELPLIKPIAQVFGIRNRQT